MKRNQPPSRPTAPQSMQQWAQLMRAVIARAEELKHPSLPGLKEALAKGTAEAHLRRRGIITLRDIDREFPRNP
jgi:hypothetical protein